MRFGGSDDFLEGSSDDFIRELGADDFCERCETIACFDRHSLHRRPHMQLVLAVYIHNDRCLVDAVKQPKSACVRKYEPFTESQAFVNKLKHSNWSRTCD